MKASVAPHFAPEQFVDSTHDSAADKAAFANRLVRLIAGDFRPTLFSRVLYQDLHLSFGFIAHYDRDGFYAAQLSTLPRRISFLKILYSGGLYHDRLVSPDPYFSRSDVEQAFHGSPWLRNHITRLTDLLGAEVETAELAELARLRDKYSALPSLP